MSSSDIVGYVDPLVLYPGDKTAVKVSCSRKQFTSKVFRLGAGYEHPNAPPISHQRVDEIPEQKHEGVPQFTRIGSFARVYSWQNFEFDLVDLVTLTFWFQATLPSGAGHDQFLFSSMDLERKIGFELLLGEDGKLFFRTGALSGYHEVRFPNVIARHQWYHVRFLVQPHSGDVLLTLEVEPGDIGAEYQELNHVYELDGPACMSSRRPLTIAGDSRDIRPSTELIQSSTFNGKIDGFKFEITSNGKAHTVLDFDFSLDVSTDRIIEASRGAHGVLINGPSRAVTGYDWDARQSDWTKADYGYGAIHFHDDDLDDAGWDTSFEFRLPSSLRSGCYAVMVDDGESTDFIPFFVKPVPAAREFPPVALIIPTFTYAGKSYPPFLA